MRFFFFEQNNEPTTLLLMRASDQIHPDQEDGPGVKVEPGETIYDAAIREISEETGIKIPFSFNDFFYLGDSHFENHLGKFQESPFFSNFLLRSIKLSLLKNIIFIARCLILNFLKKNFIRVYLSFY